MTDELTPRRQLKCSQSQTGHEWKDPNALFLICKWCKLTVRGNR